MKKSGIVLLGILLIIVMLVSVVNAACICIYPTEDGARTTGTECVDGNTLKVFWRDPDFSGGSPVCCPDPNTESGCDESCEGWRWQYTTGDYDIDCDNPNLAQYLRNAFASQCSNFPNCVCRAKKSGETGWLTYQCFDPLCTPKTCEQLFAENPGLNCGTMPDDGCGNPKDCGPCEAECDGEDDDDDGMIDDGCYSCAAGEDFIISERRYCFDFNNSISEPGARDKCQGHGGSLSSFVDDETEQDVIDIIAKYQEVYDKQIAPPDRARHLIVERECNAFRDKFGTNCGYKPYDDSDSDSILNDPNYACYNIDLFCADPGVPGTYKAGFGGQCGYMDCSVQGLVLVGPPWPHNGRLDDGGGGGAICELPIGVFDAYWANMLGVIINESEIEDTVKLIVPGYYLGGETLNFTIIKQGELSWWPPNWFDHEVDVQSSVLGFTIWIAEPTGTYNFVAEILDTADEKNSNDLDVSGTGNSPPTTEIIEPIEEDSINYVCSINTNIDFTQVSTDEDDDLRIIWDFEDGTQEEFNYCQTNNTCDTSHSYNESGVYNVVLTAEEMNRDQSASDMARIEILQPGINVIPIIIEPEFGIGYGQDLIDFNASQSYVADCDYDSTPPYDFEACGLYCDYIHSPGQRSITGNYELILTWTFPTDPEVDFQGNWSTQYNQAVEFKRFFRTPGQHIANLKIDYIPL